MTDTTTTAEILVQDTLGRVRTPREKREQTLDEYERSGMSGAAFAALVGVKYSTLSSWIQQRRKGRASASLAASSTVHWVEAVAERAAVPAATTGALRVQIGAVVWLEVNSAEQASWAGQMLRAMGVERC
jgi:transposase-like protein